MSARPAAAAAEHVEPPREVAAPVQDPHDLIVDPGVEPVMSPAVEELVIPAPSSHTITDSFMIDVAAYDELVGGHDALSAHAEPGITDGRPPAVEPQGQDAAAPAPFVPSPEGLSSPFVAPPEPVTFEEAAPAPASEPEPDLDEAMHGSWCAQCGALLSDSDIFCGECGFVRTPSSRPRDTAILDPFPWGSDQPASEVVVPQDEPHIASVPEVVFVPEPEVAPEPLHEVEPEPLPEVEPDPEGPIESVAEVPPAVIIAPPLAPPLAPPVAPLPPMPPAASQPAFPAAPRRHAPEPLDEDVEQTRIVAPGAGGDRFILQFSTGESVSVTGSGLLGRNPLAEPGEYFDALVTISDPGKSVSKTHLEFGQDGGAFWVSDRHSGNGTVVREPERPARRCEPGKRYRISRGTRVEIGEQFFIVS